MYSFFKNKQTKQKFKLYCDNGITLVLKSEIFKNNNNMQYLFLSVYVKYRYPAERY